MMQRENSSRRTSPVILARGLRLILAASGIALLMVVTGCSLISSKSVREVRVPVVVEVPQKVLCQTLSVPRIPVQELTWHPVPVSWIRQYIPTDTAIGAEQSKEHNKLLDYANTLPNEIIGLSPSDYEQFAIFFIDLESWMKSKNAQVDILRSCIERHNIQADEFSEKVSN